MSILAPICLALALCVPGDDDFTWNEALRDPATWQRRPEWLTTASPTAVLASEGQAACFRVDEPRQGMKWSRPLPSLALAEWPCVVLRYRAENLDTTSSDYVLHLADHVPKTQLAALRLNEVEADGQWHTVAVDLGSLTDAEMVDMAAVQVQAGPRGKARLWIESLYFTAEAPAGAKRLARAERAARPDWIAPLDKARWAPQPDWLGNPAADGEHNRQRSKEATVFQVAPAGRGMKWSWSLAEPLPLGNHRWLSLRYRAAGYGPHSDYALAMLGKRRGQGMDYRAAIPPGELIADGRWHVVEVDTRTLASDFVSVAGLAVQVQAATPTARLEIADLRLTDRRQSGRVADGVDWSPGARLDGFQCIPLGPAARSSSQAWCQRLRLADWFPAGTLTAHAIPFNVLSDRQADLVATRLREHGELRIPLDAQASEVYLLLLAAMAGQEEDVFGGGRLQAIRDCDRFQLRLEYADGTTDRCLPMNAASKEFGLLQGPQVLVAAADRDKRLKAVVLCDRTDRAALGAVAVTVRTGQPLFPKAAEETPPLRVRKELAPAGEATGSLVEFSSDGLTLQRWVDRRTGWNLLAEPSPLVKLQVGGKPVPREDFSPLPASPDQPQWRWFAIRGHAGLHLGLRLEEQDDRGFRLAARLENRGSQKLEALLVAPAISSYRLSDKPDDGYYLVPKRGAAFDRRTCSYRERYCGLFPVQFLDTFCPTAGRGLTLRTEDVDCLWKHYLLEKKDGRFSLGVEYAGRLEPGQSLGAAPAVVRLTDGDWRRGLEDYRRWLAGWHRPLSPRKPWFREVFNFRQRFLWWLDPLYDDKAGSLHLERALEEARREFGGIDYLHLFDWGNCGPYGRIYGRVGDHSPYDYLQGGREALQAAISGVQRQGVPVGLYIEAYLLDERGRLGQKSGRQWQMIGQAGDRRRWPESTEMYVCSFVPEWRRVQAATYAAKVRELDVDGMYLDEFGFAGSSVDCWATHHGHAGPGYAVLGERDNTRLVRESVERTKAGVALYSEETPVDVTTQYQDGSFTYSMATARLTPTLVPLNIARFAFPDFKTIEILICDKPTGSWATGVKWVFFNGEATWLEGPAEEWFAPQTRQAIRDCYCILRKHRDAMTTRAPVPLVPTEIGGVWANAFPAKGKTVYTLYNARHRTARGEVLRLPHVAGAKYYDEWHGRPAQVRIDGTWAVVSLAIDPHNVGCLVVTR